MKPFVLEHKTLFRIVQNEIMLISDSRTRIQSIMGSKVRLFWDFLGVWEHVGDLKSKINLYLVGQEEVGLPK
jgi:hypothetical protein